MTQTGRVAPKGRTPLFLLARFQSTGGGYPKVGEPRFRVPAHVATFTLIMVPALGFLAYAERFGPSEEKLEEEIKSRYGAEVRENHQHNEHMAEFFRRTMDKGGISKLDDRVEEVLHGGKGVKKRLHEIDEKLYGTAEGVAEKKRMEDELKEQKKRRKLKKRQAEEKPEQPIAVEHDKNAPKPEESSSSSPSWTRKIEPGSVGLVVVVATVAAAVGFLAGGGRSS